MEVGVAIRVMKFYERFSNIMFEEVKETLRKAREKEQAKRDTKDRQEAEERDWDYEENNEAE